MRREWNHWTGPRKAGMYAGHAFTILVVVVMVVVKMMMVTMIGENRGPDLLSIVDRSKYMVTFFNNKSNGVGQIHINPQMAL